MSQMQLQPVKKQSGCLGRILKGLLVIFGIFIALAVVAAMFNPKTSTTSRTATTTTSGQVAVSAQATEAPAVPPTATPEWMAPSFDEICGSNSELTEVQQEAKVKKMVDKKIVGWIGKVYDVKSDGDTYQVSVNMTDGFIRARDLVIEGVSEDVAVPLNVDQEISFDGTIEDIDISFGVICNPMTVVDATVTPQ